MRQLSFRNAVVFCVAAGLSACSASVDTTGTLQVADQACDVSFVILGTGQDAGVPQIGNPQDPAWLDPQKRLLATSAAIIDQRSGQRYLFEATPDIREQIQNLDELLADGEHASDSPLGLSGVFITHAHIGHYAGLMFAGRESAGTQNLPVYAMPRMTEFLAANGPWSQLVTLGNISLMPLEERASVKVAADIGVRPYTVPHRDEYSETVGFVISGPTKSVLFLPDIDDWGTWEREQGVRIDDMIKAVDWAFVDATFYDDYELPGRDMSAIPHPRVSKSMDRFDGLLESDRAKVRFIHINHTNPVRFDSSPQSKIMTDRGYKTAKRGQSYCLSGE